MATKAELYQMFGPLLIDAVIHVLVDEINELKREQGATEITEQELTDKIFINLETLANYDWMNEVI